MSREPWRRVVGLAPFAVTVEEVASKGGVVYLRWWDATLDNWRRKSLKAVLRDAKGRIRKEIETDALRAAEAQYEVLSGKRAATLPSAPLTLGDTWAIVSDRATGAYPHDTPHRREVSRALRDACRILGAATPWAAMNRARFRQLARTRVDEIRAKDPARDGFRGAEVTVDRLLAVAAVLRADERIPDAAGFAGPKWVEELASYCAEARGRPVEVRRPRHSVTEWRAVVAALADVDPRAALLFRVAVGLRPGQVVRARRRDLDFTAGTLTVHGAGTKRGVRVALTTGQRVAIRAALDTYLAPLEAAYTAGAIADYPLFPQGKLRRGACVVARHATAKPVHGRTLLGWWNAAEAAAGIAKQRGRGFYTSRRVAVDFAKAKKASREGLQAVGGWADPQIPDRIYADEEQAQGADEARALRAQLLGEDDA